MQLNASKHFQWDYKIIFEQHLTFNEKIRAIASVLQLNSFKLAISVYEQFGQDFMLSAKNKNKDSFHKINPLTGELRQKGKGIRTKRQLTKF